MTNVDLNNINDQIQKVTELVKKKRNQKDHKYLDTLLLKLKELKKISSDATDINEIVSKHILKGALKAYFETDLIESYNEPLVIELDKLETLLQQQK